MVGKLQWLVALASVAVGLVLVAQLSTAGCKTVPPQAPLEPRAETPGFHVLGLDSAGDSQSVPAAYGTRQITMTAGRYDFSPKQVVVNASDIVRLVLSSREVIHRFQLLDFGIDLMISANTSRTIDVQADRPGIYRFFWADLDGANPSEMAGTFIVQARPD